MAFSVVVLLASLWLPLQGDCQNWQDCRRRALDAAARQDYEAFHDLAWRTVQTGPRNDPSLMYLLARAQSLSGRPHDALVMLRRLADVGFAMDPGSEEDFQRVRALAGWPELEAALARRAKPDPAPAAAASKPGVPAVDSPAAAAVGAEPGAVEVARLKAGSTITPAGLAYDAVSKRFIIGDAAARKLKVIDEFSHHVVTLAGDEATGFGDITALEIDGREGDLWVASTGAAGDPAATLHKLQLISARQLEAFTLPRAVKPGRFCDVAVASGSVVLALDDAGGRVFRIRRRGRAMELLATLGDVAPTSIAPADAAAYVAHRGGVTRVDLASGRAARLGAAKHLDISGLTRIRWYRGALVGVQTVGDAESRVVRIRLDPAGRRAIAVDVLDPAVRLASTSSAVVAADTFYYLAASPGGDTVIKSVSLR